MAKVLVTRAGGTDRFGDPTGETTHEVTGAKVGWSSTKQDSDHGLITVRKVSLFFKQQVPDIQDDDKVTFADGRKFTVEGVDVWEHARREGEIAGTEVILSGAGTSK
ncbi:hypothetical protein AALI21_02760 [Corynebacteriaceae bacterium 6-324]